VPAHDNGSVQIYKTSLTTREQRELGRAERTIARGLKSFLEVGTALKRIRDERLYREQFDTFEEYCIRRWDFSRIRAYQMCAASEVVADLSTVVNIPPPGNEAQARPLTRLKEKKHRKRAWAMAIKMAAAEGRPVTARDAEEAVSVLTATIESTPVNGVAVHKSSESIRAVAILTAPVTTEIVHGDCRESLQRFERGTFDLIVTSPPYADQRGQTYGGIKPGLYVNWFLERSSEFLRVLKPTGTFILNIKEKTENGERHIYVLELILALRKQGWLWTEEYIWHKRNCHPGKWPNRFRDAWERCLQFNKTHGFKMYQDAVMVPMKDWRHARLKNLSEADKWRDNSHVQSGFGKKIVNWVGREMAYPSNVLHFATECSNKSHSATFPKALPEWFIKLFTRRGDWVLDPFTGSGTTNLVARGLERNSIGIDNLEENAVLARQSLLETDWKPSATGKPNGNDSVPRAHEPDSFNPAS
jgi:site-specific DNA-methyltransferase (adenine-specific)